MGKIAVHVKLTATEGKGAELVEAFRSLYQGPLDAEAGTEMHVIHQAKGDPDSVHFYELYSDDDALAAHSTGEALKAIFPKLAGLVAARPETTVLEPRDAKGLAL
jgi:quinol monooxygenase YgiN